MNIQSAYLRKMYTKRLKKTVESKKNDLIVLIGTEVCRIMASNTI